MNEFFRGTSESPLGFLNVNFIFKVLIFIAVLFYILYTFLLLLRTRILSDTVETPYNGLVQFVVLGNLLLALAGSFLALILILPA